MSNTDESLALLPSGFADILPPDAQAQAGMVHSLMNLFRGFGYNRIKPPLLEFEDSLLAPGPGAHLALKTFRIMDPVSKRMLGVRSDITAQVARIASSLLDKEERPLRLAYANDVLRTVAGQLRTKRQFMQVGCELIDSSQEVYPDVEICLLPLLGLKELGFDDITIDLTVPGCVALLMDKVSEGIRADVAKNVEQRDVGALKAFDDEKAMIIARMMEVSGLAHEAFPLLCEMEELKKEPQLRAHIEALAGLFMALEETLQDIGVEGVTITVDLMEQVGFEYHKAYGFTLFSAGTRGELGRGGAYDLSFGDKKKAGTARGFTLYMDTISKSAYSAEAVESVFVPADVPLSKVRGLQEQGWICVRGTKKDQVALKTCSHLYKDGLVKEL